MSTTAFGKRLKRIYTKSWTTYNCALVSFFPYFSFVKFFLLYFVVSRFLYHFFTHFFCCPLCHFQRIWQFFVCGKSQMRFASNFAYAFSDVNLFCRHRLCIHSQQTHRARRKKSEWMQSLHCFAIGTIIYAHCAFLRCFPVVKAILRFRFSVAWNVLTLIFFSLLCLYLSALAEINLNLLK